MSFVVRRTDLLERQRGGGEAEECLQGRVLAEGGTVLSRRRGDGEAGDVMTDLARLGDRRFNGYLRIRLPHELDSQVEAVVAAYVDSSEPDRRAMTNGINGRIASVLSAYGQRMASLTSSRP